MHIYIHKHLPQLWHCVSPGEENSSEGQCHIVEECVGRLGRQQLYQVRLVHLDMDVHVCMNVRMYIDR
jgi:hypothetical protein